MAEPDWYEPASLEEALRLRAELGDEAVVVAGCTFIGILVGNGLLRPAAFLSLARVPGLDQISAGAELRLGAMVRHRQVERSEVVRHGWGRLAETFAQVASARVRNQATVGGVLCDADYASDPPAMLVALDGRVRLASRAEERELPVADFIRDHYETDLRPDELLLEAVVPAPPSHAAYLKFRTRSSEDRPCVGVAVAARLDAEGRFEQLRVVVGAVSGRPQQVPEACALAVGERLTPALAAEIGRRYGVAVSTLGDIRGSAEYRTRVLPVLVRRALEQALA